MCAIYSTSVMVSAHENDTAMKFTWHFREINQLTVPMTLLKANFQLRSVGSDSEVLVWPVTVCGAGPVTKYT